MVNNQKLEEVSDLLASLKACGKHKDLHEGSRLHSEILKRGSLKHNIHLGHILLNMYAKCGEFVKSQEVFDDLPLRKILSWTMLISGYTQYEHGKEAVRCYEQMRHEGISPNAITFACILRACSSIRAVRKGMELHTEIIKDGLLDKDIVVGTALLDMYAKCGYLAKARQVFDELPFRNAVSWNALIAGYTQHGHANDALDCFEWMQSEGLCPNYATYGCILKVCGSIGAAEKGEEIHAAIVREGLLQKNNVLGMALVDMYGKCGAVARALQVFNELSVRLLVSWNALIAGYAQHGYCESVLQCFDRMQKEGHTPDAVTFTCILKACSSMGAAQKGESIHAQIIKEGLLAKNPVLGTALMNMYATLGLVIKAQQVFDDLLVRDVVSWNTLIAGYAQHGHGQAALDCFEQMQSKDVSPNAVTFACILKACGSIGAADSGEQIHMEILKQGLLGKVNELGNAVLDMYAKCGALVKAQKVFDELPFHNVISWTTLISGYAQHGYCEEALESFELMQSKGLSPDPVTYSCMVDLFGRAGHFDKVMATIKNLPSSNNLPLWHALLGACRTWGNTTIGRMAFEHTMGQDRKASMSYACMGYICAASAMQEDLYRRGALIKN